MPTRGRVVLGLSIVVGLVVVVGPLLVPVPPLADTVPPRQLADPDSRFVQVNGVALHYKVAGQREPVFVLLQGALHRVD